MAAAKKKDVSSSFVSKMSLVVLLVPIAIVSLPTMVLLLAALLPSIVVLFTENKSQYKWISVGAMNMAGTFPYLFDLWFGGLNDLDAAVSIITSPTSIIVIYGSALLGIMMNSSFPRFSDGFFRVAAYKRMNALRDQQLALVEKWGDDVKAND